MSLITHAAPFLPDTDNEVSSNPGPGESRVSRVMNRIANRKSTPKRPPSESIDKFGDFLRPTQQAEPMTNITPIDDSDDMELGNFKYNGSVGGDSSHRGSVEYPDVGDGGFVQNAASGFPGELDDAYTTDVRFPTPTTTTTAPTATTNPSIAAHSGDTLKKLDYLIHMIEEQRDHKTGRVAEELVLYSFLGVFVIFTIDSFVKVGKYTR